MKMMWCWWCKQEVPMLDEEEYSKVSAIFTECIKSIKKYREDTGASLQEMPLDEFYMPVTREYNRIAGMETNFSYHAILRHPHRLSENGPPCKVCGKPLRPPGATICKYCKSKVE